jgi:hypothetical protein
LEAPRGQGPTPSGYWGPLREKPLSTLSATRDSIGLVIPAETRSTRDGLAACESPKTPTLAGASRYQICAFVLLGSTTAD